VNQGKLKELTKGRKTEVKTNFEEALRRHSIFFDASPAADIIRLEHIQPETLIAAPGIPLGCTRELRLSERSSDPRSFADRRGNMLAEALQNPGISL